MTGFKAVQLIEITLHGSKWHEYICKRHTIKMHSIIQFHNTKELQKICLAKVGCAWTVCRNGNFKIAILC